MGNGDNNENTETFSLPKFTVKKQSSKLKINFDNINNFGNNENANEI